jgi:hypothetical protein
MQPLKSLAIVTILGGAAASVASATGCAATVDDEPVGYATVTGTPVDAPVDIETYPTVMYGGEPVYFYGNRWWHRDGGRWSYYRDEPAELRSQRAAVRNRPRPPVHMDR